MAYHPRVVDGELDDLHPHLPAVLLDGMKGVGKTETALRRAATVRRLDDPAEAAIAAADPAVVLTGDRPVLLDEWHRVPPVWDAVKRAVDRDGTGGQYLLTGSAPFGDMPTHSGAGRITALRLRPMTLVERGLTTPTVSLADLIESDGELDVEGTCSWGVGEYTTALLQSGLPGLQHLEGRPLARQLDGYLERIVDRDLGEAGFQVRRPGAVRAWLRAYAAATATTSSWETIRDAATAGVANKPAKTTTLPYIENLTGLRVLDELEAWIPGHTHLSKLTRGAKHHVADPALAARAVGVGRDQLLSGGAGEVTLPRDGTFLGGLFESLATLSVRVFAQARDARIFHLRTAGGRHEVDLIVERDDGRVVAIEVKLSRVVEDPDVHHLTWLRDRIGDQLVDAVVLTTGPQAYRRKDGIAVVPLGLLGP